jgi:hypothetical protein
MLELLIAIIICEEVIHIELSLAFSAGVQHTISALEDKLQ